MLIGCCIFIFIFIFINVKALWMIKINKRVAFTLAEVLITLGIIGVVASMTIPALINTIDDMHYKTAYRKAFADVSQAFQPGIADGSLTQRTGSYDAIATVDDWNFLRNALKVSTDCTKAQLNTCWANGDKINTNYPIAGTSRSFVDVQGRSWALYWDSESVFFADINGLKSPNQFGKDRFLFTLQNSSGSRVSVGLPAKVGIMPGGDKISADIWCDMPPCYYYSWLFK